MYKIVRNICPFLMISMSNRNNEIHKYMTRNAELLHVPFSKSNVLYKTFGHRGVKLCNYCKINVLLLCIRNIKMPTEKLLSLNHISLR